MTTDSLRPGLHVIILPNMMSSSKRSKRMGMGIPSTQKSQSTDRGEGVKHSPTGEWLRKPRILASRETLLALKRWDLVLTRPELKHPF